MVKLFNDIDNNLKECIKTNNYDRWSKFSSAITDHIADKINEYVFTKDFNSRIKMNYIRNYYLSADKIVKQKLGKIENLNIKEEQDIMEQIKGSFSRQKRWKDKDYDRLDGVPPY